MPDVTPDRPSRPRAGVSRGFVIGILAPGILLGFSLGILATNSLGSSTSQSGSLYDEDLVTSLFEKASPAVVEINVSQEAGGFVLSGTVSGSGFLVDRDGHIVTNNHVVTGTGDITVTLQDGRTVDARKLGTSPADDLALLQVDPRVVAGIDPLRFAESDDVKPGQMAVAIGSPFRNFNSVTVGVVSGRGRSPVRPPGSTGGSEPSIFQRPMPDMIQTDAPLNSGNSGGPLLNSKGEVIGVNSSVVTRSLRGLDGYRIGYAVPSDTVKNLIPQLVTPRELRRPWLGISGVPLTRDLQETLGLSKGVAVGSVWPNSPAERIGLVPFPRGPGRGDVITAVDGEAVASVNEMVSYFNRLRPGDTVTLSVFRNMETLEIQAQLVEWPDT